MTTIECNKHTDEENKHIFLDLSSKMNMYVQFAYDDIYIRESGVKKKALTSSLQFISVSQLYLTFATPWTNYTPGLLGHNQILELTQTLHVH